MLHTVHESIETGDRHLTGVSDKPLDFGLDAPVVKLDFAQFVCAHHGLVVVRYSGICLSQFEGIPIVTFGSLLNCYINPTAIKNI